MSNFFANIGNSSGTRDPVDRYETPYSITRALLRRLDLPHRLREPACGTGRMVRVMESLGYDVHATDLLEDKLDFLQDEEPCEAVVTNPPYRDGLAEAFTRHALDLTGGGPVAMLMRTGFLNSQRRYALFSKFPPSHLFFICSRIHFYYSDGTRITGQAHDHCWIAWNAKGVEGQPTKDWIGPHETPDAARNPS